jgi:hypothetical protein
VEVGGDLAVGQPVDGQLDLSLVERGEEAIEYER